MPTGRKTRFSVLRSIIRPTLNWVSAPHRVTRKAATPISCSRLSFSASLSCSSLGSSRVKALNTSPDVMAISISTTTARRTRWRGIDGNGRRLTCRWTGASGVRIHNKPAAAHNSCNVVSVSPLIRELLGICAEQPWDYAPGSRSSRLAQVLLEQLEVHEQAPLELPQVSDPRAERVAAMLRADPADRRPLAELASAAGASHRTIERLFATETGMSFGRWRVRHRMITALEQLAHGVSVSDVAYAVGYETPSSFIAAFRASFGTTPTAYFQDVHDRRAGTE
jgi:AraC-like DNA-binding protein